MAHFTLWRLNPSTTAAWGWGELSVGVQQPQEAGGDVSYGVHAVS